MILVVLGGAIFGMIHLTRTWERGERATAWVVFVLAIILVFWKLAQMGVLGRVSGADS